MDVFGGMPVSHGMLGGLWQAIRPPACGYCPVGQYATCSPLLHVIFSYNRRMIMKKVTVCIGSACHLKGSRHVVEQLQYFIAQNHLDDRVELSGTFCMGQCQKDVCVSVDDTFHSVSPETVKDFFEKEILAKV